MPTSSTKIALVTGASRGLGRNMAIALARKGVDVIGTNHSNKAEADATVAGKRGKTVGTQAPHTANANDQIGDRNENIGVATSQAGRSLALT